MTMTDRPASGPAKTALRAAALARRAGLGEDHRRLAAARLAAADLSLPAGATVSGFLPIRGEIDATALLAALAERGHPLALPAVLGRTEMVFRHWRPGAPLEAAAFGLSHPPAAAGTVDPDVLLVPLAAFDKRGHRIGYGGGYYDRALASLDAAGRRLAIGVAFAVQEVDRVPDEPHDRPLDAVLTEAGLLVPG